MKEEGMFYSLKNMIEVVVEWTTMNRNKITARLLCLALAALCAAAPAVAAAQTISAQVDALEPYIGNFPPNIHSKDEMMRWRQAMGPLHPVGILEQRDNVACASSFDSFVEARQRADMNHRNSLLGAPL